MGAGIRSVLVAVDFSEASASATALAGRIASACDASLRLLHAEPLEAPPYFTQEQMSALDRERETTRTQAARYLAQFGRQYTHHPFSVVIDDRSPVDAILKESVGADLVVLGTHGRRGPSRWWMGSVAERVVRESTRPVLVVRAGQVNIDSMSRLSPVLLEATSPPAVDEHRAYAAAFATSLGAELFDTDGRPLQEAVAATNPALVIVRATHPAGLWPGSHESLIRTCHVPVLFVPERL